MRFKRAADPLAYAVVYWVMFFAFNLTLVYYAYSKIADIVSRDYFVQTQKVLPTDNGGLSTFPDFMFCTTGATVTQLTRFQGESSADFTLKTAIYPLASLDQLHASPCAHVHDQLTIFSLEQQTTTATNNVTVNFDIFPRDANNRTEYERYNARVYIMPSHANPYMVPGATTLTPLDVQPATLDDNFYTVSQNETGTRMRVTPTSTRIIKKGFRGLFNQYEDVLEHSVASSSQAFSYYSSGKLIVHVPFALRESQVLITSIPSAIGDWGGAFTTGMVIFYLLFGLPRLNPFGLIPGLLMRGIMKRNLEKVYGSWRRQPSFEAERNFSRSPPSSPREYDLPPAHHQQPHDKAELDPTDDHYDLSSVPAGARGLRRGGSASLGMSVNTTDFKEMQKQVLEQARQLERVETQFRELQDLLKDYYLDFSLVNTDEVGQYKNFSRFSGLRSRLRGSSRGQDRQIVRTFDIEPKDQYELSRMVAPEP